MRVEATYKIVYYFDIPEGVTLLSKLSNECAKLGETGSWWVRYAVLHYVDKDGNTCEVEGSPEDTDLKWADSERLVLDEDEYWASYLRNLDRLDEK